MTNVFEDVRERVTLSDAISFLGLKPTEKKGDQLRFECPHCQGSDKRTLSVNLQNGFRCFKSDKKGNDATALVAHCRNIRQREAADLLADHFLRSSTKPRQATVEAKGRSETSEDAFRPLEILGIPGDLADRLHIVEEAGRVLFEQRDAQGIKLGTLAIATRDDLPLVEWIAEQEAKPDGLKGLWRVVKGGA